MPIQYQPRTHNPLLRRLEELPPAPVKFRNIFTNLLKKADAKKPKAPTVSKTNNAPILTSPPPPYSRHPPQPKPLQPSRPSQPSQPPNLRKAPPSRASDSSYKRRLRRHPARRGIIHRYAAIAKKGKKLFTSTTDLLCAPKGGRTRGLKEVALGLLDLGKETTGLLFCDAPKALFALNWAASKLNKDTYKTGLRLTGAEERLIFGLRSRGLPLPLTESEFDIQRAKSQQRFQNSPKGQEFWRLREAIKRQKRTLKTKQDQVEGYRPGKEEAKVLKERCERKQAAEKKEGLQDSVYYRGARGEFWDSKVAGAA